MVDRSALLERVLSSCDRTGACWTWTGQLHEGYGRAYVDGRTRPAHRVVYELLVGPIPEGLQLDHVCHNEAVARGECSGGPTCSHRACVNPDHLKPATGWENNRGSLSLSALNARKTHCPQGHPFDEENTLIHRGRRVCLMCKRAWDVAYERRRAERLAGDARRRSGVTLPFVCWDWLTATAARDGSTRDDLIKSLVLLAMDRTEAVHGDTENPA